MEKKSSFSNGDGLSTKAIAGKLDVNIPYHWKSLKEDVFVSKVIGVKGAAGIDDYSLKVASEASTLKYEVEVSMLHFPDRLPIIGDTDLKIKGDLGLGAIGLKGSVGKETGITVPVLEGFTVGSSFKFEKPEEKK